MGERSDTPLKLEFDHRVRLEFRRATITSEAGRLATMASGALRDSQRQPTNISMSRTGRPDRIGVQHRPLPLLRQSVYSRLAGYDDTNPPQAD